MTHYTFYPNSFMHTKIYEECISYIHADTLCVCVGGGGGLGGVLGCVGGMGWARLTPQNLI